MKRVTIAAMIGCCLGPLTFNAPPASAQADATVTAVRVGARAAAPMVDRVEPPNWWAGDSINPVRLLIHGRNLAGASLACGRLSCAAATVNAAGTYAFADVTIPRDLPPGAYPLTLSTPGGKVQVPFTVAEPLARAGRFQGFGPNDVIYLIMPDRFANGDPRNDEPAISRGLFDRTKPKYYHGGDLAGIRQHLPYLKELGVTAIWLNPIYDNVNHPNQKQAEQGRAVTDYHGYGAVDFYKVEEHFGDLPGLRQLVDDAHRLGIKVILDMVANHTGPDHPWVADPPTPTWFNGTAGAHLSNEWRTWTLADPHATPATQRGTLEGWFGGVLPDLNQNDPEAARYIIQNTLWWIGVSGIDGIRQDTWPYVPRTFWKDWIAAIRRDYPALNVVGEVFDGDPSVVSFFQGGHTGFDGIDDGNDVFDFPLAFAIRNSFAQGRPLMEVVQMLARDHVYPRPDSLVTFLGNHDIARFMGEQGATTAGLRLAFTFLLTTRGAPLIYYGDEIALPGANDPDNRRDFPGGWSDDPRSAFTAASRTPEEQAVWSHIQKLLRLRAERTDLRTAPVQDLFAGEQVYVYRRGASIVALNNDTKPVDVKLLVPELPPDALGACATPRKEADTVVLTIPARTGCVF